MGWELDGRPVAAASVRDVLRERIAEGRLETWFADGSRSRGGVTNGERAMVMLLDGEGDPGEHATTPGADGWSDGFVLANGQADEYPDVDTVPLPDALRIVEQLVAGDGPPENWQVDR